MLATVNVIDVIDSVNHQIERLEAFPDNPDGNKQAESRFVEWIKEAGNAPSDEEIQVALESGIFEIGEGAILLVHSSGGDVP